MEYNDLKIKVKSLIKQNKTRAEVAAQDNLESALKNREFKSNFKSLKALNFEIAKKEFLNENVSSLKKDLIKAQKEQLQILKKMGKTPQDLTPQYSCKKCNDSGVFQTDFCSCYYELLNKEIIKNLGVSVNKTHTFLNADFDLFDDKEKVKKLYEKLSDWCDKFPQSNYKNIVLVGGTGVGKTYLAECICNQLINKNLVVNFYTSFSLNNKFLKFHTTFDYSKYGILEGILNCDVLFIDDLGSEPIYNNVTEQYLYLVLNERLTKNKSTIVSTNLMPDEIIDKYGERIFSRLFNKSNGLLFKIENKDLRLKRKK